jgi:hypothetical protein
VTILRNIVFRKTFRKQWAAAFLLLLYTFIATPVQWLHHHTYHQDNKNNLTASRDKRSVVIARSTAAYADDCKACSHKYSASIDPSFFPAHFIACTYSEYTVSHKQRLSNCFCAALTNKGPPFLI